MTGGIIFPVILAQLIPTVGFGWAVRIIGFIALITLAIAILLSKPLGPRTTRQLFDKSAILEPSYLMFMASAFCTLYTGERMPRS